MRVPKIWSVVVNSVNVTTAIATSIVSLNFIDIFQSGASTAEIELLTSSPYVPVIGQFIEIKFGYLDTPGTVITTGTMRIDNVVETFRPNTVKYNAIAWEQGTEALDEGYSYGYQNYNLKAAIDNSASILGLTVSSLPSPLSSTLIIGTTSTLSAAPGNTVSITSTGGRYRLLEKIANEYGYAFQVKGGVLSFKRLADMRAAAAIATLSAINCKTGASFRNNVSGVVKTVSVTTRSGTTAPYTDANAPSYVNTKVQISDYFENLAATAARAEGLLAEKNSKILTGTIAIAGSLVYTAGATINLSDFPAFYNRKWLINQVAHDFGAKGWTEELSIQAA